MSVKVKSVRLVNYCGYEDVTFDFASKKGVKGFAVFYGPNGIGKSTGLHGIRMCGNADVFQRRIGPDGKVEVNALLRSSIYDVEYLPNVDMMSNKVKNDMLIETVFHTPDGDKRVAIDGFGTLVNELPKTKYKGGYTYFADADHPNAVQKFMLAAEEKDKFLDFCGAVYGYPCSLGAPVPLGNYLVYTDFIIQKGRVKVHFKRMSAGEKKIATLVSDICQPLNTEGRDIILIDNVEMHVYRKRHTKMIDKLIEMFPNKQIISTTHSSHVIDHVHPFYHYDLEEFRPDYRLFDQDTGGAIGENPESEE